MQVESHLHAANYNPGLHHRPQVILYHSTDEEIYAQGDDVGPCYEVVYGAVRIHRLLDDGRRQIVAFYLAGETFGFEAGDSRSFFAEAVTETGLRAFKQPNTPEASGALLSLALRRMVRAKEHLMVVGRMTAFEKVAGFLVDVSDRQGHSDEIDLAMPRLDMADFLGLAIETVSRVFRKLQQQGYISLTTARHVKIERLAALRSVSGGGYCASTEPSAFELRQVLQAA